MGLGTSWDGGRDWMGLKVPSNLNCSEFHENFPRKVVDSPVLITFRIWLGHPVLFPRKAGSVGSFPAWNSTVLGSS